MAQTTQITIDNQTFPSFREKLNQSLSALNTLNSGTSRPSSAVAGTIWLDTTSATNPTLKFFDGTDDISLATIDYTANTVNWLDSSVNLVSPVTISGNDTAGAEIRLPEDTDNGSNYIGLKAADNIASNITFTLPNTDGSDGQALKTDGSGNLSFGDAGRTGAVNWDTTAKTASFTAVSGNGYFIDTSSSAITITLPASPSAGDIVGIKDYSGTFSTNNLTIARNSSNLDGSAADTIRDTDNESLTLIYVDGTQGWKSIEEGTGYIGETFIEATGGTITTCGDFKIHTFTGPGTFCVSAIGASPINQSVDYLVIAGGGSGGAGDRQSRGSGAGGGGGFRESHCSSVSGCYTASPLASSSSLSVTVQGYPITVGAGATTPSPAPNNIPGNKGSNSVFSTITSSGGGGGMAAGGAHGNGAGGSGGAANAGPGRTGALGNSPPVSPPQGQPGGDGGPASGAYQAGGGGGATAAGQDGPAGGTGGAGAGTNINTATGEAGPGPSRYYSGGGAGGGFGPAFTAQTGGVGGGADRPDPPSYANGEAGTTNTGGGGSGTKGHPGAGGTSTTGGAGGSGIVIIRYKYQ